MADYHVSTNRLTGKIYAGLVNKGGTRWLQKSDVTDEAIEAVRDHFVQRLTLDETWAGYEWERTDGSKLRLTIEVSI